MEPKSVTEGKSKPLTVELATDQKQRELFLRLLWQASRQVKGATYTEIQQKLPELRAWVGVDRAEALEKSWRTGRGIE